jgi:hypothetical protein
MSKMLNKSSQAYAATIAAFLFLTAGSAPCASVPYDNDYAFGVDVSFVKSRVDRGGEYRDADEVRHPLGILRDHGYNWGRVHLCNEPVRRLPQTLDYVIASGRDLKEHGMKFLLDLIFSNGWANPTTQPTPSLWEDMSHEERVQAVYEFCRDTLTALRDADAMPDMVQVGNEIGNGFLWLGDTAWSIFNQASPEQIDQYLADRAGKGFNVVQGCIVLWNGLRRPNPDGELPFIDRDPSQINEAFFKNVDGIIDKAERHGLYMAILPVWIKGYIRNLSGRRRLLRLHLHARRPNRRNRPRRTLRRHTDRALV